MIGSQFQNDVLDGLVAVDTAVEVPASVSHGSDSAVVVKFDVIVGFALGI